MVCFLKKNCPVLLILALASALRVHLLFVRGTFWFDEMFSARFSSFPWKETIKYWIIETNPPFYTLFTRFWLALINSDSEILARLPSVIAGIASIALLYFFAKKFFNKRAAIAGSLLFALADIHIFISTEARCYSFLCLLSIASFFFYYLIFFQNKKTLPYWSGYFLTNFLLIFTHLTALSVPFAQMFGLIMAAPEKKDKIKWWLGHIIIGLAWLCWLIPSIIAKIDPASLTMWYFDNGSIIGANLFTLIAAIFSASSFQPAILSFLLIAIIIAAIKYFQQIKTAGTETRNRLIILASWALALPVAGSMLGVLSATKFYISSAPALYLMAGYSISAFAKQTKTFALAIAVIILFALPSSVKMANTQIFSWRDFTEYIEQNETKNSVVIITPFNETLPMEQYFKGRSPIIGIYLREDSLSRDERMARYNWNKQITTKEDLEKWLKNKISGKEKIFYIQYTDEFSWTPQILVANGWTIKNKIAPDALVDIRMFEFNAPK